MRIAFVCQWFPPEPVSTPLWIAQALQRRKQDVRVLTGVPNYPSGSVLGEYKAYRASRETVEGIPVRRTPLYPSHDRRIVGRVLNYVSWALSSTVMGQHDLRNADAVLVYSSPATAALPALWARWRWGTPFVLLIQDIWPDSVLSTGFVNGRVVARLIQALVGRFVGLSYRAADHIAVISPGMIELLLERGVPRSKISLVYNWAADNFAPQPSSRRLRDSLAVGDGLLVMYAGNHGAAQALDVPIRAMGRLQSDVDANLILVGDGVEKPHLRQLADEVAPGRIHFLEPVPAGDMPSLMAGADVQLVSLRDDPLFRHTMPSKVQTILASGLPLIVVAPGDAGAVPLEAGAGWSVAPGDEQALAEAIGTAVRTPRPRLLELGANALAWYQAVMAEQVNGDRLVHLLSDAAEGRAAKGDRNPLGNGERPDVQAPKPAHDNTRKAV